MRTLRTKILGLSPDPAIAGHELFDPGQLILTSLNLKLLFYKMGILSTSWEQVWIRRANNVKHLPQDLGYKQHKWPLLLCASRTFWVDGWALHGELLFLSDFLFLFAEDRSPMCWWSCGSQEMGSRPPAHSTALSGTVQTGFQFRAWQWTSGILTNSYFKKVPFLPESKEMLYPLATQPK